MALRAWQLWGTSAALAGGLVAWAQTPPPVNGRATPAITQDYFQPEAAPPPRLLPQQVRDANPPKPAPPTAGFGRVDPLVTPATVQGHLGSTDWKARAAFDVAEMYFDACDLDQARAWYQEVIKLAPGTKVATVAAERIELLTVRPAAGQSSEPPLADANRPEAQARIR
jgi:hypothetical protein